MPTRTETWPLSPSCLGAGITTLLFVNYGTTCSREREKEELMDTVKINVENLLPADPGYYTFSRSLTTPPCNENVTCSC